MERNHLLRLKIMLVKNKEIDIAESSQMVQYPSKLLIVIKRDYTITDLCTQIEQNVQSMGYKYLHVQYISTSDMFRLSPKQILNEIVANNSDLIATYCIHYSSKQKTHTLNNSKQKDANNNLSSLQCIIQDHKQDLLNHMTKCYQIMKQYDSKEIERSVLNITTKQNSANERDVNIEDVLLYTVFLCSIKVNNVELQSKATQIAYCILNVIMDKHLHSAHNKARIEYILHELICSDYIDDNQRIHLLDITHISSEYTATESLVASQKGSRSTVDTIDSLQALNIDTASVLSKVRNVNQIIKNVLHNALLSNHINSKATNTFTSIINHPMSTEHALKYGDILKCCRYINKFHFRYMEKNKNVQQSDAYSSGIINLNHIAEALINKLVEQLQSVLFGDNQHHEIEIHGFLDLLCDNKLPQKWREFNIIITGIDLIWKHLTRIVSPNNNNDISNTCTIMIRLRVHLLSVMFMLLEQCQLNKKSEIVQERSHFGLLEQFVLKWIADTSDAMEFSQIIANKKIENVLAWTIKIQKAYFSKILCTSFLDQSIVYHSISNAVDIIKYIIKYPILLNDDSTAETVSSAKIDFNYKKIYLQMVQKGLQKPQQKAKIIQQFASVLLSRLRFATYSKEQILLLRLLCLFHKNCKHQLCKDKIVRNVKDIYEDGKLANLTTQSYVDLLLQSVPNTPSCSVSLGK